MKDAFRSGSLGILDNRMDEAPSTFGPQSRRTYAFGYSQLHDFYRRFIEEKKRSVATSNGLPDSENKFVAFEASRSSRMSTSK